MREIILTCSCGGTTTVWIEEESKSPLAQCACGKILLGRSPKHEASAGGVLSLSVTDSVGVKESI